MDGRVLSHSQLNNLKLGLVDGLFYEWSSSFPTAKVESYRCI
ncbi:hypothetical protein TL13_1663 [Streptococcus suis TL13]|nr:hypothetical protein TL13_1663 [Streptococcus suis TL13]